MSDSRTTAPVYGGECRIEDGTLTVSHSPLRAVNPVVILAVVALLLLSLSDFLTGFRIGRPGGTAGWQEGVVFAVLLVVLSLASAYRTDVLTDQRVPLSAITAVRIAEESRRWYFKQTRTLPTVVVEYSTAGETTTYPIRLALHGGEYDRELREVRSLFEAHGFHVRDDREATVATEL